MVTEGLSVAVNNDPVGNLTRGWTTLPQCPLSTDPDSDPGCPGCNSWAYTACTASYCNNASIICNQTRCAQAIGCSFF